MPIFSPPFPVNSTSIDVGLLKIGPANQEKSFGKTHGDSPNGNIDIQTLLDSRLFNLRRFQRQEVALHPDGCKHFYVGVNP